MNLREKVISLRKNGKSYGQIQQILRLQIPKSTLSYWCRDISLPPHYPEMIARLMSQGASKGRAVAWIKSQERRENEYRELTQRLAPLAQRLLDKEVALLALSMLCLGEASKKEGSFCLGSSDPRIIRLFLGFLKICIDFNLEKVRCTVQCRADQDQEKLERFWSETAQVPRRLFYKAQVDPRTIGKPTLNLGYKGVLRVDYFDSRLSKTMNVLYNLSAETVWNVTNLGR